MQTKNKKLVYGVGINDADYAVQKFEYMGRLNGKKLSKRIWTCPYYSKWSGMLERGHSDKFKRKQPSYKDVTVCTEWHRFSNFKSWMEKQDWEGKELDKDILFPGNKVYSPATCVFVLRIINTFILESNSTRGEYMIGVQYHSSTGKLRAVCNNPITKKRESLGLFFCEQAAHNAWLSRKLELAKELAAEQSDPRVAKALIERYENYGE